MKDLVSKKIREQIPKAQLKFEDFNFPDQPKEKVENEVSAAAKDKEHKVKVILKLAKCNLCEKEGTEYFEATLQIRSANFDILEESIEYLQVRVANLRHRGMFINNVKRQPEGFDLYMSNKRIAQSLGRELQEKYGGVFKASPRLQTRNHQTSKNVYRMNILVKLPDFVKGDIILTDDGNVLRVDKLGKKIKLYDLDKGTNIVIDYEKLKYHILKKHSTYVSKVQPGLEVINPFDYQSSMVKNNPERRPDLGAEVQVVVHKGIYILS